MKIGGFNKFFDLFRTFFNKLTYFDQIQQLFLDFKILVVIFIDFVAKIQIPMTKSDHIFLLKSDLISIWFKFKAQVDLIALAF